MDIERNLKSYLRDRDTLDRYASFDYCFNYFQSYQERGCAEQLAAPSAMQLSCLQLGFYLASWGMLRGSTKLLQLSVKSLVPVIEVIACSPEFAWQADADDYSGRIRRELCDLAQRLKEVLPAPASDTLVTKIMLGVFGSVPALDANVVEGSGWRRLDDRSLREIGQFYAENREVIDAHRVATLDFDTGFETKRRYTRAKVIDMIFFEEGRLRLAQDVGRAGPPIERSGNRGDPLPLVTRRSAEFVRTGPPTFAEVFRCLVERGPAIALSSRGTRYSVTASDRGARPTIVGRLSPTAAIRVHEDCWGEAVTCQGTRAGGLYHGNPSLFDWYRQHCEGD